MPDRTELDEEERDRSSSTNDALSASEGEWSAESALPESNGAAEDHSANAESASEADDTAESDGVVTNDGNKTEGVEPAHEHSDEGRTPTDEASEATEATSAEISTDEASDQTETIPAETAAETATDEEESKKRAWVPWLVGLPIVAAIALAVGFLIADLGGNDGRPGNVNDPTLRGEQAAWDIRSFVIGGRYVDGAPKTPPPDLEGDLSQVVTEIHDALFLRPSRLDDVTKRFFSSAAAKSFEKASIGIPKNADEVQTTRRRARIGVEAASTERATALVQITAEGEAGGETFRSSAESNLFLEKTDSGWKVIGYEVEQRPGDPFSREDKAKKPQEKADAKKNGDGGKKTKGKGKDKK